MRIERVEGALVLHLGVGEWYKQRFWGMCEDVGLPPALWHMEVEAALHSNGPLPAMVAIDATEIVCLVGQDYGYFAELAKRLHREGVRLAVVARTNEIRAYAIIRDHMPDSLELVATLDAALRSR